MIVDIGANAGAFSVLAALTWPSADVLAFEPVPAAYRCLAANASHWPRLRAFGYGLGLGDRQLPLHSHPAFSCWTMFGSQGLVPTTQDMLDLRDAKTALIEHGVFQVDILKVDTEECELPILHSLGDWLPRIKVLFIEYHSEDDRRAIDNLLSRSHKAHHSKVAMPHRGEWCFIANDLATEWEKQRINLPSIVEWQQFNATCPPV